VARSICISLSTAPSTCSNDGTPRVTAISMQRVPGGTGRPASPITSASPWPRLAIRPESSAWSNAVFFMA